MENEKRLNSIKKISDFINANARDDERQELHDNLSCLENESSSEKKERCAYCFEEATTEDNLQLPACQRHATAADGYLGIEPSDTWLSGI